jgi:hypothetical protein
MAMVEAVRTTASTFTIWVIVAVAMISLAAWLVGVYVADNYQTRLSRQRRRMDAPGPALAEAGVSAASIPGQRRDAGQPEPEPGPEPAPETTPETVAARGRHARPAEYYAAADFYGTADYKAAEKTPAGNPETSARGVADPETGGQADAPTRPDLPAQPAQTAEPTSTGRHAMPAQRSGDSDRAERTYAGPDADQDDQDQR